MALFTVWDFIGDIHGMAKQLKQLLKLLGYNATSSHNYSHPEGRKVVFLGDYIDRGPNVVETLRIVKTMCHSGNAVAILGNHEFNLLCYLAKRHIKISGQPTYVRRHNKTHSQESAITRKEFSHLPDHGKEFISWFYSLPLFIETPAFRAVHASYVPEAIAEISQAAKAGILQKNAPQTQLQRQIGSSITITSKSISSYPQLKIKHAIDTTLKGREVPLPPELHFADNDGNLRTKARVQWWRLNKHTKIVLEHKNGHSDVHSEDSTSTNERHLSEFLMIPTTHRKKVDALPTEVKQKMLEVLLKHKGKITAAQKPTFFGHYWMRGEPKLLTNWATCLDFSVAYGGKIVAYQFDGEQTLNPAKLVWV